MGKLRHRMAEIDKQDDGRGPVELEHEPAVIDRIELGGKEREYYTSVARLK